MEYLEFGVYLVLVVVPARLGGGTGSTEGCYDDCSASY